MLIPTFSDDYADIDNQLFSIPFAKSAVAGQHSPDNTRYAFIQLDDRVLVYRGADQPDMSIINPESDVWHHVKVRELMYDRLMSTLLTSIDRHLIRACRFPNNTSPRTGRSATHQ